MATPLPVPPKPAQPSASSFQVIARWTGLLVLVGAVPMALFLPLGPKLIWTVIIAAVPLGFTLAGFYAWRKACPLAWFATLGQRLKRQSKRKAGEWLSRNHFLVQLSLLAAALAWRNLGANGTPWALAGLLLAVVAAATAVGFLYTGKTWCNYLCPVGVVEKFYLEPAQLQESSANSQCAPCTACKKNCPDIETEQAYWKELELPARRHAYFAWPGIVLGFYSYFYLSTGNWESYFGGGWTRDPRLATRMLQPGFFFLPALPRLVAVPLTLLVFALLSHGLFSLGERVFLARAEDEEGRQKVKHRALALAGFSGFLCFYTFAGQPALASWARPAVTTLVAVTATLVLLARWRRSEAIFVQEKFAKGLLKRWEWGDMPPSDRLTDIFLLHQERTQQREARLRAYKATMEDLLASGVLNASNLLMLQTLRVELGVTEKDHAKLLSELSAEQKRLFDPEHQGSMERQLQLDQYRRQLEAYFKAETSAKGPDPVVVEALRLEHCVSKEDHEQLLRALKGDEGPLISRLEGPVAELASLHLALLAADPIEALPCPGGRPLLARKRRLDFYRHVIDGRQRDQLDLLLNLLGFVAGGPELEELRLTLLMPGPEALSRALMDLPILFPDGALGRALAPLADPPAQIQQPGPALRRAAADPSPFLRAAALSLLAYLPEDAARAALQHGLKDRDALVIDTAETTLDATRDLHAEQDATVDGDPLWLARIAARAASPASAINHIGHSTLRQSRKVLVPGAKGPAARLARLEILMHLHQVPIFRELEADDLQCLADAAEERSFSVDENLCRQGEWSDEVFLVLRGKVRVWLTTQGQGPRVLGDSGEGECLGEMAVLDPAPRTATITALDDTLALVLHGSAFRGILAERPALSEGVIRVLTQRLRGMIEHARV